MNNLPIGVFDSGIGGLTVLKELIKELPGESFIYLGDTARVPYGTRDKETIKKFSLELVRFLMNKKVKALVVACNTISAVSLSEIKKESTVPVIDVISPTVNFVTENFRNKRIGVIGTRGTVNSKSYEKAFKKFNIEIKTRACPLFVPLVEEGLVNSEATEIIAMDYLNGLRVDCLVLGCTHYPLLYKTIQKVMGPAVKLVDSAHPTSKALGTLLFENKLLANHYNRPKYTFYVTDDTKKTEEVARLIFNQNIKLRKVSL